jgi:alpha-L-rhamnosidase
MTGVPTDCPQRDERLGWTGDIQVFCQTACFNMDMAAFLTKFVLDLRDAQDAKGRFPNYAPRPYYGGGGSPGWADAGVIIPWRAYQNYGDTRLLAEHFDAARRWVDYVHRINPSLIWCNDRGADFGDWLNADTWALDGWPKTGGAAPKEVYATAFFAHAAELLGKIAAVLGRDKERTDYERLASDIKAAFMEEFVSDDGRIRGDTQAGYALALAFYLLPNELRQRALDHMLDAIAAYRGHLSTGIQGTVRLMLELTRAGRTDRAYEILNLRELPSWGYALDQGATTIWERWDGYTPERGFQDPVMNSLNHWALGAVGEWVWRTVAGINPDEAGPGYRRTRIRPEPGGGLTWARAAYRSIRGRIALEWTARAGEFALRVEVPPNVTATVYLPDGSAGIEVVPGTHQFRCALPTSTEGAPL